MGKICILEYSYEENFESYGAIGVEQMVYG